MVKQLVKPVKVHLPGQSRPTIDNTPPEKDMEYEHGVPRPHHYFYFSTGDIVFQVNNALFKIHRHFLVEHSEMIKDMLDPSMHHMSSDDNLVQLSGDKVQDWEAFLQLFYRENPCAPAKLVAKQWASVLLLAHKYLMDRIELSALKELRDARPPLDMVELMVVAQVVDSQELYQIALRELAQRDQVLSLEEAQKIGLKAFHDVVTTEHVYFVRTKRLFDTKFARRREGLFPASDSD